jgi:hypothetical protein
MSETSTFLAGAGAIFTAFAGFLWGAASKTEELMRDDVKEGFANWLKSTSFDRPFRDWTYSFTYLYDTIFGIRSRYESFGFPRFSRTAILATICLVLVFFLLLAKGLQHLMPLASCCRTMISQNDFHNLRDLSSPISY